MSWWERRRFLGPKNRGIRLGENARLSLADSFRNLVLVAPTGSGKTSRYVIPNVLLAEGSVVVTDPSAEIFRSTAGHLERRGFRIEVLEPTAFGGSGSVPALASASGRRSLRFNPLHYWRTPQQLRELSTILAGTIQGPHADPFWSASGANLIFVGLSAVLAMTDASMVNLGTVRRLLNRIDLQEHDRSLESFLESHLKRSATSGAFEDYLAFRGMESRVKSSILATARAALDLWSDPEICRFTAENTIGIDALRRVPTAIYLILPEHRVAYFSVIANLFYSAVFGHCIETGADSRDAGLPVFFFLDEFGNLGKIHDAAAMLTTLRKRRCSVSIVLQDISQLRAVYGADTAQAILAGGTGSKLFLGGLDLETARYVEGLLGERTEYDTVFGGVSESAGTVGVPLMSADEIRRLPKDEAILVSGNLRPVRLTMPPFGDVQVQGMNPN